MKWKSLLNTKKLKSYGDGWELQRLQSLAAAKCSQLPSGGDRPVKFSQRLQHASMQTLYGWRTSIPKQTLFRPSALTFRASASPGSFSRPCHGTMCASAPLGRHHFWEKKPTNLFFEVISLMKIQAMALEELRKLRHAHLRKRAASTLWSSTYPLRGFPATSACFPE